MFVYKKLKPSDVSITPFEAHKQYNYDSSSAGSNGITFSTAYWTSESKAHYSSNNLAGNFYNHRKYFQLDKIFYRNYITDNANLIPDVNYIKQERRLYDKVNILSIPQSLFGSRIQPTTFDLTGSFNDNTTIEIKDDGEGNIYPTNYTLGSVNWPSEKGRIIYIGPVHGFVKKDLTVDNKTGNKIVNGTDSFTLENVYDDSYYLNQVDYNKITFTGDTPLTFINTGVDGHLRLDHSELYNFGFNDDFNISFYFKTTDNDISKISGAAGNNKYYFIAKSDVKTIIPTPNEGSSEILSTFISGNLQPIDVPSEGKFPFKLYYTDDVDETGSLFFERSDGSNIAFVSTSLFYSDSTDELIHISAQKTGSKLQLWINGVKSVDGDDLDPNICKGIPPTNQANVYIGTRGNIDSYLNSKISQLMVWDSALTSTQIQNISESITGTPYIGNIFYDEGFITINHPSYSDVLQQYSSLQSETITLNPTYGDENTHDVSAIAFTDPTFDVDVNFYNEKAQFWFKPNGHSFVNSTTAYKPPVGSGWHQYSPTLETDLGNITIGAVNEETFRFDFMTASSFVVTDLSKQPFTASGSNNSITAPPPSGFVTSIPNSNPYAFLSSSVLEVTESVNILFASNSQQIITEDFDGASQSDIGDTEFVFGNQSIGSANLANLGGDYHDDSTDGLHLVATRTNTAEYFLGELTGLLNQTSGVGDVDWNEYTNFSFSSQTVPFGVTQGADFRLTPHHDIKFLTDPDNITVEITGSISSLERIENDRGFEPARLFVGLGINGGTPIEILDDDSFTGGEFKASWNNDPGGAQNYINITPDDILSAYVKITGWDTSGNTYQYKITKFKITSPDPGNVFDNHIVVSSSFNTKLSSSYTIKVHDLDPTNNNIDSTFLGLHQDGNGNDLGIKVNLYKQIGLSPTLLTSSFYSSGSVGPTNDFTYTHLTDPTETEQLKVFVMASNTTALGSVPIGISQSFSIGSYNVTEKSGSNELNLDTSLGANFGDLQYEPIITFGANSGSISGVNPVSINSISSDVATVTDEYLITTSIPATASYFVKQKISASANLDILTSSLFTVENFSLGVAPNNPVNDNVFATLASSSLLNDLNPRVRFYSGSDLLTTVIGGSGTSSIENLSLGYLDSGSILGIHIDVVDSSNTPATSSTGEGISLDELQISGISSSITLSLSASDTTFDPEITHIQFTSPHVGSGDNRLPFSTGEITASVNYVDNYNVTLDSSETLLFTTESLGTVNMIASSSEGFPITITWTFEGGGDGSIYRFYTGSNFYTSLIDITRTEGEVDDNEGVTLFIKDILGNTLATSSYINSASSATTVLELNNPEFTSSIDDIILVELKTTNSHSIEIPVTWDIGLAPYINDYSNYRKGDLIGSPFLAELSASYVSNTFNNNLVTNDGGTYNEDIFKIISPHNDTGSFPNSPFTTGTNEIQGSVAVVNDSVISQITLDSPLFITASAAVTGGSAATQYFLTQESQSATSLPSSILEGSFDIGDTTYNIESIDGTNLIIDQPLILTTDTNVTLNYHSTASNDFTLKFKNTHLIFEHEYQCSVDENEYNYTQNISVKKHKSNQSADLADCVTGSIDNSQITLFKPYTTTVGLYDDDYNLLAVGKFAQPIKMSEETDMTFVIRWDT